MVQIIPYNDSFLFHLIRLRQPDVKSVDGQLDYFRLQLGIAQPDQVLLMLVDDQKLLSSAQLYPLAPDKSVLGMRLAAAEYVQHEYLAMLWDQLLENAAKQFGTPLHLRTIIPHQSTLTSLLEEKGLKPGLALTEFSISLADMSLPATDPEIIKITSLSAAPEREGQWIEVFNQGHAASWDYPLFSPEQMAARKQGAGYNPGGFQLGLVNNKPVGAMFYELVDREQALVEIHAASTASGTRARDYSRRMLRNMLAHLEEQGIKYARLHAESHHHAGNLLYKMMGFQATGTRVIWESINPISPPPTKEKADLSALNEALQKIAREGSIIPRDEQASHRD